MTQDIDELIKREADARDFTRRTAAVMESARVTHRAAMDKLEEANKELRMEVRRRVDELSPPQDGDRTF